MKGKSFCEALSVLLFFQMLACSDPPTPEKKGPDETAVPLDTNYTKIGYDTAIISIDRRTPDMETWDALFAIKDFINLYEHASWYTAEATDFLSIASHTQRQKSIALCSLQALSLDQYLPILRKCDSLFKEGKLSELLLSWSINPNFSKRHLIVRNYEDPRLQKILTNILEHDLLSDGFKSELKSILSGFHWDHIRDAEGLQ